MNSHDAAIWKSLGLGPVWVPRPEPGQSTFQPRPGVLLVGEFDAQTTPGGRLRPAGKGGELLLQMLGAIGWQLQADPEPEPTLLCLPLAAGDDARQTIASSGRLQVVVIGQSGVQAVWGSQATLAALRGQVHTLPWGGAGAQPVLAAVLHAPATLLAQPMLKRQAWEDLCLIRARFELPH